MTNKREPRLLGDDTEYRAICAYEPPSATRCENPAEVHLLSEMKSSPGVTVTLATCQRHYRIALASAPSVDEHEYRGLCGLPGTAWNHREKQCVIDDSGQEPKLRTLADATIGSDR